MTNFDDERDKACCSTADILQPLLDPGSPGPRAGYLGKVGMRPSRRVERLSVGIMSENQSVRRTAKGADGSEKERRRPRLRNEADYKDSLVRESIVEQVVV